MVCVFQWDPGCLVGDDAVDLRPQLPGGGRIAQLLGLCLSGQLVDVRVAVTSGTVTAPAVEPPPFLRGTLASRSGVSGTGVGRRACQYRFADAGHIRHR